MLLNFLKIRGVFFLLVFDAYFRLGLICPTGLRKVPTGIKPPQWLELGKPRRKKNCAKREGMW